MQLGAQATLSCGEDLSRYTGLSFRQRQAITNSIFVNLRLKSRTATSDEGGQSESFPREKQLVQDGESMPKAITKAKTEVKRQRLTEQPLTPREKRELAAMPDDQIDTSDIPELPPNAWKDAIRGRFHRPLKQAVSMRLDADVVAWLKKRGKGYQTRANNILRQRMLDETKRA
jgi:uncharacterized protein (DUF4415 family)